MIASNSASTTQPSEKSNIYSLRWDGHMANDVGNTVGPEPAATLSVNADEIWLKGTLGDFHIPRGAVKKVSRGGMYPWVFMCVRIRHNVPGFPEHLQFKPLFARSSEVIEKVKALGYPAS